MIYLLIGLYYIMSAFDTFMLVYCIFTWIPRLYGTKVFNFFQKGTNLFLKPFRGFLMIGRVDFTPLLGFIIYGFATRCLSRFISYLIQILGA